MRAVRVQVPLPEARVMVQIVVVPVLTVTFAPGIPLSCEVTVTVRCSAC